MRMTKAQRQRRDSIIRLYDRHNPGGRGDLSPALQGWVEDTQMRPELVRYGRKGWCTGCGSWIGLPDGNAPRVCPVCGERFGAESISRKQHATRDGYALELTMWEGLQVIRTIRWKVIAKAGREVVRSAVRVFDWLLDGEGGEWCFSRSVSAYFYSRDIWRLNDPMKLQCDPHKGYKWREGWDIAAQYPRKRIAGWARLRGYDGHRLTGIDAYCALTGLLGNPHVETAWKVGIRGLAAMLVYRPSSDRRWPQVKIALRAGFGFGDPQMWLDHLDLLEREGYDISNPKYIAPADLEAEHRRVQEAAIRRRDREARRAERERERRNRVRLDPRSEENRRYRERLGAALEFRAERGGIVIRPLADIQDFFDEGSTLHHCVYSNGYYHQRGSVILDASVDGERTETLEVRVKDGSIEQCRGKYNQPSGRHDDILALMKDSMPRLLRLCSPAI